MKLAFLLVLASLALPAMAQTPPPGPPPCPIVFTSFNPDGPSTHVRNVSGKTIVGLSFYAALADATEHWKWFHYNFDLTRPLREFGWNKEIKDGASKGLSWGREDLNFEHGGGGAFILTSALFADGTSWEESPTGHNCSAVWTNSHKKTFTRPMDLPPRAE